MRNNSDRIASLVCMLIAAVMTISIGLYAYRTVTRAFDDLNTRFEEMITIP